MNAGSLASRRTTGLASIVLILAGAALAGCGPTSRAGSQPTSTRPAATSSATTIVSTSEADSASARYGVHLDVLEDGNQLRTIDGHLYPLGPGNLNAIRVPAGWLYGEVWKDQRLLRTDGTSITLIGVRANEETFEQPGVPVVSADGTHIAWVAGTTMHAGTLTSDGVTNLVNSTVPARTFAATWIGSRVVVGNSYTTTGCCGYNKAQYDVWDPAMGAFAPHWTKGLEPVYGPVPAGVNAFALVGQDAGKTTACLAVVDGVNSMAPKSRTCLPGLAVASLMGLLSPDGRRLAELDFKDDYEMVIDLTTNPPTKAGFNCGANQPIAWENSTTLLIAHNGQHDIIRCDVTTGATTKVGEIHAKIISRYGI